MSSSDNNNNLQPETTETSTALTTDKWKDPEYVKAYYRQYHRKRRVYKLHPYKLDDGRLWRDVHTFPPKFESKEAYEQFKKERNKSYVKSKPEVIYVPVQSIKCDLCDCEIKRGKWQGHLNSVKHKKNEALLEKHGVSVSVEA